MNEEEFLKDHPGLVGKEVFFRKNMKNVMIPLTQDFEKDIFTEVIVSLKDIHETQLDNQKVKEAIDKMFPTDDELNVDSILNNAKLKKELGL